MTPPALRRLAPSTPLAARAVALPADASALDAVLLALGSAVEAVRSHAQLERSNSLVADVFPPHIATVLTAPGRRARSAEWPRSRGCRSVAEEKAARGALPLPGSSIHLAPVPPAHSDAFDSVSIVFADVVSFTPLCRVLSPDEVMLMLNELFSRADDVATRWRAFKVETIGDCYSA